MGDINSDISVRKGTSHGHGRELYSIADQRGSAQDQLGRGKRKTTSGWDGQIQQDPGILTEEIPYRKKSRNITKALLWGKREEAVAITAMRMDMTKIRLT